MVYKYSWATGDYPVSAQEAGEYLEDLSVKNGRISAEMVLDEARAEDALLHPCFEWDDSIAAERYRKRQASHLIGNIRRVVVEVTANEEPSEPVRAFVNTAPVGFRTEGAYQPIVLALCDSESRTNVLARAKRELASFAAKYSALEELASVIAAINALAD